MITIDPATAATFITLLLAIIGGTFWLGKLSNRVDRLENLVKQLQQGLEELRKGQQEILILLHSHLAAHQAMAQPPNPPPQNPPPPVEP